jgi:type IV pilus assembly protein PilC
MMASHGNRHDRTGEPPAAVGPADGAAMLVEAGLPLEAGLRALGEEVPSSRLRYVLQQMSNELAAGSSPEEVLSRGGRGLPRYIRSLISTGVQNGQLGTYLAEFLVILRRRKRTVLELLLPLLNPLFLVPLTLWLVGIPLSSIVGQFKEIFNNFGVELPAPTRVLLKLGDLNSARSLILGLTVILAAVALILLLRLALGAAMWTRTVQKIPLIGSNSRMRGLSEFCSLLGLLVSGHVPLPDALEITSGALKDPNLKAGSLKLAARVREGDSLSEGAQSLVHFSAELRNLFRWETRGAAFGQILRQAGVVFNARSRVHLGLLLLIIPPLLVLVVGGTLAFTAVALFMPLVQLLNELS